jgi:hypothetical protein
VGRDQSLRAARIGNKIAYTFKASNSYKERRIDGRNEGQSVARSFEEVAMKRILRHSRLFQFLLIFGGYILFVSGISYSDSIVLQPGPEGKDAGVTSSFGWSGDNFGSSDMFIGIGLISTSAAFIEFDLSTLPEGAVINSATITLWAKYIDGQIYFKPVISAWDEMSITWDNQPGTLLPEISYPISRGEPDGPCYMGCAWEFDITSIVQYWIDNSNFGIWVAADTPGFGWLMISSDNLTYPTPKLTVEYSTLAAEQTSWGTIKELYR